MAQVALEAAQQAVAEYSHIKSPRKFTQPQLLACLIVKELRGLDYRGIHVMLDEWSDHSKWKISYRSYHGRYTETSQMVRGKRS